MCGGWREIGWKRAFADETFFQPSALCAAVNNLSVARTADIARDLGIPGDLDRSEGKNEAANAQFVNVVCLTYN